MAPRRTKLQMALGSIEDSFKESGENVFMHTELRRFLEGNRSAWELPGSTTLGKFIETLTEASALREIRIELPHRPVVRYAWNSPTTMEIVQSISTVGYFSHYSAIFLHGLTMQIPKSIYFNIEHLIATEAELVSNQFTGRTTGTLNMRDGKVERLKAWLKARSLRLKDLDSTAYSDSINDLPLLEAVNHPVTVNADRQLAKIAGEKNWFAINLR